MDLRLLRQADMIVSRCGRPTPPVGVSVVYIPKGFVVQFVDTYGPAVVEKEVTGDTTWCLRAISGTLIDQVESIFVQIRLPDGRFLLNEFMQAQQFVGYGSYRYLLPREVCCPVGSIIQVTLDTSSMATPTTQAIVLLFEGAYRYDMRSNERVAISPEVLGSQLPRYLRTEAQNILAPCWMSGEGPCTPAGYIDERWIYSMPTVTIPVPEAASPDGLPGQFRTSKIKIDEWGDFECRRILAEVTVSDPAIVAGRILSRFRLSSGYELTDDYVDISAYLAAAPWAKDWHCPNGDYVVCDFMLVDAVAVSGTVSIKIHLDGVNRKKVT